ncbi:hypothetical protein ACFL0I_01710, partial [Gemmatimonadota bacterium]
EVLMIQILQKESMEKVEGGGGMDPEAMRRAVQVTQTMAQTPDELTLTLLPETVTLTFPDLAALQVTLDGESRESLQGDLTVFSQGEWTQKGLEIERNTELGGGVDDTISLDEQGRLIINREVDLRGRGVVKGKLVFQRKN